MNNLKACALFFDIYYQNRALKKSWKMPFILPKKLFLFLRNTNFGIFPTPFYFALLFVAEFIDEPD